MFPCQPQRSSCGSGALGSAFTSAKLQLFQARHTKASNHLGYALIQATDKLETWPGLVKSGYLAVLRMELLYREFQRLPDAVTGLADPTHNRSGTGGSQAIQTRVQGPFERLLAFF